MAIAEGNNVNVDRLRRAYRLWVESGGADASALLALMDDNIQYVAGGEAPPRPGYFRMHRTHEAMRDYFSALYRDWKMLAYLAEEFVACGNTVAMRGQCAFEFRRTGRVCETIEINWWHFKGDKAVALYHAFDTASMIACMSP